MVLVLPTSPSWIWLRLIKASLLLQILLKSTLAYVSLRSPLKASLNFLTLSLVTGPTGTSNGSFDGWIASLPLYHAQIFGVVFVGCFPWSSMDSLLHVDEVRSGQSTDTTTVPTKKIHNFWTDRRIALKFLEEFPYGVFLWVAWNRYFTLTMSVGAFHRNDQSTGSKSL
jgi:hypothetical protein